MQVFLLGNGFDLNHKLPTKYISFMHTVQHLVKNYTDEIDSVGKVFGAIELQKMDKDIENSYAQFAKVYDSVVLPREQIRRLIDEARVNPWYKYFAASLYEELNWIDFETEIARVIDALSKVLKNEHQTYFYMGRSAPTKSERYIVESFPFFYDKSKGSSVSGARYDIKSEYISECPYGSKEEIVQRKEIIGDLYQELRKLAEMLKTYLSCFVDGLTGKLRETGMYPEYSFYSQADEVYTFNYTDTFEKLYGDRVTIAHIHGSTSGNIVLGVNPDEKDELDALDTSFIQFKKYYQRVFWSTDHAYLEGIEGLRKAHVNRGKIMLHVVGHSLDVTDKDIIQDVFAACEEIIIYYYCEEEVGKYIRNLIKMYGKSNFDMLRNEKKLMFCELGTVKWKNN